MLLFMQPSVSAQFFHTVCANLDVFAVQIRDLSAAGVVGEDIRKLQSVQWKRGLIRTLL